jgi:hypothetical protein
MARMLASSGRSRRPYAATVTTTFARRLAVPDQGNRFGGAFQQVLGVDDGVQVATSIRARNSSSVSVSTATDTGR